MLNRGQYRHGRRSPAWWNYCEEHNYGRVQLDDGIFHAYELDYDPAEEGDGAAG